MGGDTKFYQKENLKRWLGSEKFIEHAEAEVVPSSSSVKVNLI